MTKCHKNALNEKIWGIKMIFKIKSKITLISIILGIVLALVCGITCLIVFKPIVYGAPPVGPVNLVISPSEGGYAVFTNKNDGSKQNLYDGDNISNAPAGAGYTLEAVPYEGYAFLRWEYTPEGGTDTIIKTSLMIEHAGAQLFYLYFESISNTIAVTSNNTSMGTVTGSGEYTNGSTATLTATPAEGYHFVNWTNSSGAVLSTSATYYHPVTTSEAITANFAPNTYSVTLDQQSGSGGTTSITATYNSAMPSATAPTRTGYTFQGYFTGTNGSGTQYYTNTMTSAKNWTETTVTTLYAYWQINQYTISTAVTPNGVGQVTGGGTYDCNSSIILTATPTDNTYTFDYWDKNGVRLTGANETSNTLNITVTETATYTAHFRLVTYDVTINVNDSNLGQVLYNNQLNSNIDIVTGTNLTNLFAISNANSAFVCWQITTSSDTTTETTNPLNTTITADTTITAVYTSSLMEGIGVTAIGGGQVRMGGYEGNIDENTQVTLNAICYSGYTFDGWYTMENGVLTKIEELGNNTAVIINAKSYESKLIIAKFEPVSNDNINDDVNN